MHRILGRSAVGIAIGLLAMAADGQSAGSLPRVTGYVTQVDSTGFLADGDLVETTSKTQFYTIEAGRKRQVDVLPSLYLGEPIEIWGKFRDKHSNVIIAQVIHVTPPHSGPVAGLGIILVAESNPAAAERMLIADGYRLHLTPHTHLELDPPLQSLADLGPNCWLGYRGVQGADGTVEVSDALGLPNIVDPDEVDKRRKQEFDPASIDVNARQSGIARALIGFNRKKLPVHPDAAIQARIQRIGESLIPEYQRKLPPDDATRIPFRFQVVDIEDVREPITFPNGIVLVPFLTVRRLTDDAQVAALLADGIAGILEKQELVDSAAHTALSTAAKWATLGINGVYLTPLAIASGQPILPLNRQVTEREKQQSGRISLWLMHQAGYDLTKAPIAWWLLAPSKPQPLENTDVPERANTLYNALGTTWREALVKQP